MERLIWFSQILCLSFMLLHFRVQCSSPSQSSLDSPPYLCRPEERSALLDFNSTTDLAEECSGIPLPIQTWNKNIDCCLWEGITCDKKKGHVIGLDLSWNCIHANLTTNSSLFRLEKLQRLNLAGNAFDYPSISFGFHHWKSLTYLNHADSGYMNDFLLFEIFSLPKLVSLDLSQNYGLLLDNVKFQMLVHNLTELRFLNLDCVDMSLVVPSSLLNLTSSLEHLSLTGCSLQGNFPSQNFQLPSLQFLDLSFNYNLSGNLPESNWSSPLKDLSLQITSFSGELPHSIGNLKLLEELYLNDLSLQITSFSGELPHSIGNLKLLEELYLNDCQFYGSIPRSLVNLTEITSLDFSFNHLQGQIPDVIGKMHKLTHLSFGANNFDGEIAASVFNLTHLTFLSLSSNKLIGRVPSWLFSLPSLYHLDLSNNKLTGPIDHIEMSNLILQEVDLSNNEISGSIPSSLFDLVNLYRVDLSTNNLSGTITPNMLSKLVGLMHLDLSNNGLLSLSNNDTAVKYSFPKLWSLRFSACNIQKFPSFLRKAESLEVLDISKNNISGQIHKWEIEGMPLNVLNLSYNFLTGIDLSSFQFLQIVDLRSNLLQGALPILSTNLDYMQQLFISGNNLTGKIPSSYCNLTSLSILDLANNSLGGRIPECLGNFSDLLILDLQMNKFHGTIPNSFVNGSDLTTFNLNGNQLEGILPPSLANCSSLTIIDVGNNYLDDTFPHWLGVLPWLDVLILRSNRFHGAINNSLPALYFPVLRIIDVSQNDFTGLLPCNYFKNLKAMKDVHGDEARLDFFPNASLGWSPIYFGNVIIHYEISVKVVIKGMELKLILNMKLKSVRISNTFTTIDFSSNQFHGWIPEELGELNSLVSLNLSYNSLTGQIPPSLGKITELESLDLSSNKLEGRIPEQLTNLTFLEVLNLSHNKFEGDIPEGKQFNTFSNDSYIGNSGLCGFPLTKKCHNESEPRTPPPKFDEEDDSAKLFNWKFAVAGYGCGVVLGLSLGYIVFTTGKPWWVVKKVEKYKLKFVRRCTHKRRKPQKPNQHS